MKKFKIDRIISIATLVASLIAIVLVLKKPAPVAQPQTPAAIAANAQSFDQKMAQLQQAAQQSQPASSSSFQGNNSQPASDTTSSTPKAQVRINSDEINAAITQALGAASGASSLGPDTNIGSGAPTIKDQKVSFDGDVVHGQFLTEVAGKDVWITVSGHIGEKNGYATFDPTEFKVGDLNIPISLVNPALQKKMSEERDRLKLPDSVGDVKVQNSELVMEQK
jgi:hypothetical protein